jgi:hypothetical protein
MVNENKSRIIYLLKCLEEKSDEDSPVSTGDILAYLTEYGINTHAG